MQKIEYKQHTGLLSGWVDGLRTQKIAEHINPGEKILDVGCGSALLLGAVPPTCVYVGVDRDPDVIVKNQQRFSTAEFFVVDVCSSPLPFPDQSFDVVAMGAFLEHVEEAAHFFSEITRVLKVGGRVIATTPSPSGMWLHEILSSIRLLSHDAAEEHKGAFTRASWGPILEKEDLHITVDEKFELGLNQIFILERGHA